MRFDSDGKYAVYARQDLIGDIGPQRSFAQYGFFVVFVDADKRHLDRAVVRIVNDKPGSPAVGGGSVRGIGEMGRLRGGFRLSRVDRGLQ